MSYDDLIEMCENCNVIHERRIIVRDIAFMLSEFKKNRKLGIINPTLRKELADLITKMGAPHIRRVRPGQLWEYGCYFRLKECYLDMFVGTDTKPVFYYDEEHSTWVKKQ